MTQPCKFPGCETPRHAKSSLCGGHRSQWERSKELTPIAPKLTDAERFWSKVDKSGECWTWIEPITPSGYGRMNIGGRRGKYWLAHRYSYTLAFGPIEQGMHIDHRCLNRACVNPEHLRLASNKQNMENRAGANKNSKSGVLGVCWHPRTGKWLAQITHNRQPMSLGYFGSIAEADAAVTAKRLELFTHNELDRIAA